MNFIINIIIQNKSEVAINFSFTNCRQRAPLADRHAIDRMNTPAPTNHDDFDRATCKMVREVEH